MANTTHPVTLSAQASYTLEDAIAHLLGLLKRGLVKSEIKFTLSGVAQEDLHEISTLPGTLNEHLIALTNATLSEGNTEEVARIDQLLNAADTYMQYMTDEIAKGPGSAIRIDQDATQKTGVRHFTLKSINDWFRNNKEMLEKELGRTAEIVPTEAQSLAAEAESPTKTRNLNITLGLLLKLFVEQENCSAIYKDGDQPNFSTFGEKLEKLIEKLNGGKMTGQSSQTIRKALSAAYKELPRSKSS